MRAFRWIGFVAARYVSIGRRNPSAPASVFAVLGIFTGVLALTVILAVMNGFQLGFIESIVEISSYHARIEPLPDAPEGQALVERIRRLPGVVSAVPFREIQGIVRGNREAQQAVVVRGMPPQVLEIDRGMAEKLEFTAGSFSLGRDDAVVLGVELARRLGVRVGDGITLISLSGFFPGSLPEDAGEGDYRFTVTGVFRSGFYEYDLGWAFVNNVAAGNIGGDAPLSLGIKFRSRWQDERGMESVRRLDEYRSITEKTGMDVMRSWRDYNRAFFGALRTEKLLMFTLVGLIFIVVGLNIFQAQRRSVLERREEIGLLRALGGGGRAVRLIFVWDGFIIGFTGASLGMTAGILIAGNINAFFSVLEGVINFFINLLNGLAVVFHRGGSVMDENFAVFSPAVFYIKEVPVRIIPHEVILIFLFGLLSALLAAWFASGKVSRTNPAEVLRYE
ncbi:MAG: ABC transporter permease [Treponema sp.]|nr:ABC transporter permease [Treponema sp.]